jgi:hypothetical protein
MSGSLGTRETWCSLSRCLDLTAARKVARTRAPVARNKSRVVRRAGFRNFECNRNAVYIGESSEKVIVQCTVCPWVHVASTAVESFLFRL